MFNKYSNKCEIDGLLITSEVGRAIHKLSFHLKFKHNISLEDYSLKYIYNGHVPKCACGCNENVKFFKGRYLKYFSDHKNAVLPSDEIKKKTRINRQIKNDLNYRLERLGFNVDELIDLYNKFINFEINLSDIEKIYAIDKRTLKKYWNELQIINNNEEFERICKRHKHYWANKNDAHKTLIPENILFEIYGFLVKNSGKYTLKEIKNILNLEYTTLVIYKRLIEIFNKKEVNELLKLGISSKPEIEFFNVLRYYYGKDIQKNFILEKKHYDYILLGKILIEYDGDYWHSNIRNVIIDKEKNSIAQNNGYVIIRIKDSEAKNIEVINNINILYLKYKQSEN